MDELNFGTLEAKKAGGPEAVRRKFRIALMGDFSGRANRGALEEGDALAARRAIRFDVDNLDDVIEGFGTTLTLEIGDGSVVEVPLRSLWDMHPDDLSENVDAFSEMTTLRRRVQSGKGLDELKEWGEEHGKKKKKGRRRAKGSEVPADLRLSAFQQLIGDTKPRPEATESDELIARIVGPYIVRAPDPGQAAMVAAVDASMSAMMRGILHHPDFQAVEQAWRSLDLIARRVETGSALEVVVYDIAAEEMAADLAAQDDLSESGLFKLLAEKPLEDTRDGPFSAIFGLYTFQETPPHAELLGRMAKIAAHAGAPFVTALSAKTLDTPIKERHPLVSDAWEALQALPEAGFLGLAAPRFLLRRPYGKKTDPIDRFDFEEFTPEEGLGGMLWGNPAVAALVLLAENARRGGREIDLTKVLSLGEMPYHFVKDAHGDQVALPCTERMLSQRRADEARDHGIMPLLAMKGRDEVRLAGFTSVSGAALLGVWSSGEALEIARQPGSRMTTEIGFGAGLKAAPPAADDDDDAGGDDEDGDGDGDDADSDDDFSGFGDDDDEGGGDDDDGGLDLDFGDSDNDDDEDPLAGLDDDDDGDGDDDLDALLAGLGDDDGSDEPDSGDDDDDDDDEMDPELAALLKDLE